MPTSTTPSSATSVMAQEFKISTRCRLQVRVPGAHTVLRPGSKGNRVEVNVAVSGCAPEEAQYVLERMELNTRQVKDEVRVISQNGRPQADARWWAWLREHEATVHLDIRLPKASDVSLSTPGGTIDAAEIDGELDLDVAGGTLTARDVRGSLSVRAFGGEVTVRGFQGELLQARVASGALTLTDVKADAIRVETAAAPATLTRVAGRTTLAVNGAGATLREMTGALDVRVHGGPLDVDGTPGEAADLAAFGAPLRLTLPASHGADLVAEGTSIAIADALRFTGDRRTRRARGTLNGGGPTLRLRAVDGAVEVHT